MLGCPIWPLYVSPLEILLERLLKPCRPSSFFSRQAFGAKQYHKLGEIVQRALLLNTAACIPIGILWLYAERVLLALGQQEEIAITTAKFLGGLFVGLLGSAWRVPLVRYLAAQNVVRPVAVCAAITVLCHAAVTYVLVFPLGFGLMGAAYAFSFTQVFYLALLFGYIMCSTIRETTWSSWSWRATFSDLGLHLALALPSMVMVCLECWSYEVALFLAGLLPNPKVQLSTVNIAINIMMLAFTFGAGWSIAISVRVSNELGANSPERARLAVISAISAALLTSGIVSSGLFLSRNVVGRAFTDSKAIVRLTATLVPILCIAAAADTVQFTMSGVLRGTGKQKLGAACNLFSYYVVGIPLAILFGFYYNLGAIGMWSGLTGALLCNLCIYLFIASRVDWKAEAEKAQARTSDKAREPLV